MTTRAPSRQLLLVTSDDEPNAALEAALDDAGFQIRRCVEPGAPAFPCVALDEGTCPLDDGLVDVVLDVRAHPWPRPTPREQGVRCALRQHLPLVVAGRAGLHPFTRWTTVTIDGTEDAVAACERAIDLRLDKVRTAVKAAVEAVLQTHAVDTAVTVDATRVAGVLQVEVQGELPAALRSVVAARAGAAARGADSLATAIEIDLAEPEGDVTCR